MGGYSTASVVVLGVRRASSFLERMPNTSVHRQYIRHLTLQGNAREAPHFLPWVQCITQKFPFFLLEYLKLNPTEESCHFLPRKEAELSFRIPWGFLNSQTFHDKYLSNLQGSYAEFSPRIMLKMQFMGL